MKVILFDGVCNLCNSLVNWIIEHDKKEQFKFATLQSEYGKKVIEKFSIHEQYMDTVILAEDEKIFLRSTAILRILKSLGGVYSLCYFSIIVPSFIRNFFYRVVANNRYSWFGKRDNCMIPTPELKARFLE